MIELTSRVLVALGNPCWVCSKVVGILLMAPHDRHAFDRAVEHLSCPSREALAGLIRKHGMPSPRRLQNWLRVATMLEATRVAGWSLQGYAYTHGVEPSVLYRAVAGLTPEPWATVRAQGLESWLARLGQEVGGRLRCTGAPAR